MHYVVILAFTYYMYKKELLKYLYIPLLKFLYTTGFREREINNSRKCKCFILLRIVKRAKTLAFYHTFGGWIVRATRIPADEQCRLIMECRTSGLTDHEWYLQHDIKQGTFYNWVSRLCKAGYSILGSANRVSPIPVT